MGSSRSLDVIWRVAVLLKKMLYCSGLAYGFWVSPLFFLFEVACENVERVMKCEERRSNLRWRNKGEAR